MRAFVEAVGNALGIPQRDLIEKDMILHRLLGSLPESFRNRLLFKGGTCLIKAYLGYYRFSEDLDFTWRDQNAFSGMSQKQVRSHLSGMIEGIGRVFEGLGEDFVYDKGDKRYVELGGSNKTVTFKLWYDSGILKHESFVKVQISFIEKILYPPSTRELNSLLSGREHDDLRASFPEEYGEYGREVSFPVYDIKEIFCEKVRAILTRRGVSARDFVDAYLISKTYGIDVEELRPQIVDKTVFALGMYEKYRKNLEEKVRLINSKSIFEWGRERDLLLLRIDEMEFYDFVREFIGELEIIAADIRRE